MEPGETKKLFYGYGFLYGFNAGGNFWKTQTWVLAKWIFVSICEDVGWLKLDLRRPLARDVEVAVEEQGEGLVMCTCRIVDLPTIPARRQ